VVTHVLSESAIKSTAQKLPGKQPTTNRAFTFHVIMTVSGGNGEVLYTSDGRYFFRFQRSFSAEESNKILVKPCHGLYKGTITHILVETEAIQAKF
jgi:hypothetical protein